MADTATADGIRIAERGRVSSAEANSRGRVRGNRRTMRILVVEDEHKVAQALREGLEAEGYEVVMAERGRRASSCVSSRAGGAENPEKRRCHRNGASLSLTRLTLTINDCYA